MLATARRGSCADRREPGRQGECPAPPPPASHGARSSLTACPGTRSPPRRRGEWALARDPACLAAFLATAAAPPRASQPDLVATYSDAAGSGTTGVPDLCEALRAPPSEMGEKRSVTTAIIGWESGGAVAKLVRAVKGRTPARDESHAEAWPRSWAPGPRASVGDASAACRACARDWLDQTPRASPTIARTPGGKWSSIRRIPSASTTASFPHLPEECPPLRRPPPAPFRRAYVKASGARAPASPRGDRALGAFVLFYATDDDVAGRQPNADQCRRASRQAGRCGAARWRSPARLPRTAGCRTGPYLEERGQPSRRRP